MRGPIDGCVLLIIDTLDDVRLLAHSGIRKNGISSGQIFQVCLERPDINRGTVRNILGKTEGVGDFLDTIDSGELTYANAHGVARMNETVRAGHDAAVCSIRIRGRPISCAFDLSGLNRAITDCSA